MLKILFSAVIIGVGAIQMNAGAIFAATGAQQDAASPGGAQAAAVTPGIAAVEKMIGQLTSSQWQQRNEAQEWLMEQGPAIEPVIERHLKLNTDPELGVLLARIGLQLYMQQFNPSQGLRPILGIHYSLAPLETTIDGRPVWIGAIAVEDVLPGFPAARVLHPGDTIVAINSLTMPPDAAPEDFQKLIMQLSPGSIVIVDVFSDTKIRKIPVQLSQGPTDPGLLDAMMEQREQLSNAYLARYAPRAAGQLSFSSGSATVDTPRTVAAAQQARQH
jgi:hypothetical protein